ncbi:MAG: hypothetical protein CMF81_06015 [Candidatus Marinimicrobia bacterium]|nr:hypothetical protein [Candidatus Neomarinimicrobiota bacterium]
MTKFLLPLLLLSNSIAQDSLSTTVSDTIQIDQIKKELSDSTNINPLDRITESDAIEELGSAEQNQEKTYNDSIEESITLPDVRKLTKETDKLDFDKPFFELKSSIDLLHQQVDSLKKVISTYEEGKGAMPTIDEDLLNLIKVPQLRHRVELQNGTIVNGEIIEEDELGIIIQTSIGQLAIEKDRIIDIMEDLPPIAKVELISEPFVDAFPDREEITGSIKNIGTKRADFVRVIAHLWSPTTSLLQQDSVFISGKNQKYYTGIKSDSALEPGAIVDFKITIPLTEADEVSYRTYEVRWESYK